MTRRDREAAIGRTWPLLIAGCLAASGCTHVTHTADVEPGLSVSLAGGAGGEWLTSDKKFASTNEPLPARFAGAWDAALNVGYGWRFTRDVAISTTLTFPYGGRYDGERFTALPLIGASLDSYFQLVHDPIDLGFGLQLGNATGLYLEAGRGWATAGGPELRIDGGLRLARVAGSVEDMTTAVIPFALFTARGETFHAGLWADTWIMAPALWRCGDGCGGRQPVAVAVMGGAVVGFNYDPTR